MSPRLRTVAAGLACVLTLSLVVVLAMRAEGREETRASSNDGGAWLIDRTLGTLNHVEYSTKQATVRVTVGDPGAAVSALQAPGVVAVHDRTAGVLRLVDPANALQQAETQLPVDADVRVRPNGVIVNDPTTSRLWLLDQGDLAGQQQLEETPATWSFAATHLTVGASGMVAGVVDDLLVWPSASGESPAEAALPAGFVPQHASMTGDEVVLVDGDRWLVATPGSVEMLSVAVGSVLAAQQEGAEWPWFGVVTESGDAVVVDVAEGTSQLVGDGLSVSGVADPIFHEGCLHTLTGTGGERVWNAFCGDERSFFSELAISANAQLRLVNGEVWIDELDGSGFLVTPDLELEEVSDISSIFDREDGDESPDGDNVQEVFDQQDPDARTGEGDPRPNEGPNEPPVAEDDQDATRLGRPVVVDVLANDSDPDSDVILVESATLVTGQAEVVVAPSGTNVQVTPGGGAQTVTVEYTIWDGRPGGRDSALITVDVLPLSQENNRPPTAVLDRVTGATGKVVSANLLQNDDDPDGDALILKRLESANGVEVIAAHPSGDVYLSVPVATTEGTITVPYVVEDEWRLETEGLLEITVRLEGSNTKPDARNDAGVTQVGQEIVLDLLANDVDAENDLLVIGQQATPLDPDLGDLVTTTDDGEFRFVPTRPGTFLFTYSATDRQASDEALVRIEVRGETDPEAPIAVRDDVRLSLGETRLVRALDNDGDRNGDLFGVVDRVDNPRLKVVERPGVGFLVTMEASAGAVETFQYRLSDGNLTSDFATVVVARSQEVFQDAPPVASPDVARVRAGRTSQLSALRNDFDPEGGPLVITGATSTNPDVDVRVGSDGQVLLVEVPAETVAPFGLQYQVADEVENVSSATVQVVMVSPEEPNTAPMARPDVAYTIQEQPVVVEPLLNDSDPESDAFGIVAIPRQAQGGAAEIGPDGRTVRYVPNPGFRGTDRFTYRVEDSEGGVATGTVRVGVMPEPLVNRPPTAVDDEYDHEAGTGTVELPVLVNDRDPDGDDLLIVDVTGDRATIAPDGRSILLPVPDQVTGSQAIGFSYTISDSRGGEDSADVSVTVEQELDPVAPIANPDTFGPVRPGEPVEVNVLFNDQDPDGRVEDLTVVDSAGNSIPGGILRFTAPDESVEVGYTITDPDGLSDSSFVAVTVVEDLAPEVDAPIYLGEFRPDDEIPLIELDRYARDPEGGPLEFFGISSQVGGTTLVSEDSPDARRITFIRSPEFFDEAGFAFSVRDEAGNLATGRVTLTLLPAENELPVATDTVISLEAGRDATVRFDALITDPDPGDELDFEVVSGPGAPVTIVEDLRACCGTPGVRVTTPASAGEGETTMVVRGTDGEGESAQATVTFAVSPSTLGPPEVFDETATTNQGEPVTVDVLQNDINTLGEGELSIVGVFAPDGVATIAGHEITFTPAPEFFGDAVIQYTVADARGVDGGQAAGVLTVTVIGRPSAPTGLTATAIGPQDVALSWVAPANNGARIEQYVIEVNGLDPRVVPATPAFTFDDLTPGTEYVFRVRADNVAGEGEWSSQSVPVTPDALPPPPGRPSVLFGDGELAVTWTEPVGHEGSPITGYDLEISQCASTTTTVSSLSFTWTGLVNGERCAFRVYANNAAGQSIASAISDSECPVGLPDAPGTPVAVRGDRQATISWSQPASPDCEGLLGYEIVRYVNGGEDDRDGVAAGVLTDLASGLLNGETYTFAVRAENRAGWGPLGPESPGVVPCGVPMAPPPPDVTPGNTLVTVARTGDAPANGCAVTQYQVSYNGGAWAQLPVDGNVTGLTNGSSYTFQVRGVNEMGEGDASAPSAAVTPAGPPLLPAFFDLVTRGGSTERQWWVVNSADPNGSPVTSYVIEGDTLSSAVSIPDSLIAGLGGSFFVGSWVADCRNVQGNQCGWGFGAFTPPTELCYQYPATVTATAYAVNEIGPGPARQASRSLPGCPAAPSLTVTPGDESFTVAWTTPSIGWIVMHLQVDGQWVNQVVGGVESPTWSGSPHTVVAQNGRTYSVQMWACNVPYGCTGSPVRTVTPQAPIVDVYDARAFTGSYQLCSGLASGSPSGSGAPAGTYRSTFTVPAGVDALIDATLPGQGTWGVSYTITANGVTRSTSSTGGGTWNFADIAVSAGQTVTLTATPISNGVNRGAAIGYGSGSGLTVTNPCTWAGSVWPSTTIGGAGVAMRVRGQ